MCLNTIQIFSFAWFTIYSLSIFEMANRPDNSLHLLISQTRFASFANIIRPSLNRWRGCSLHLFTIGLHDLYYSDTLLRSNVLNSPVTSSDVRTRKIPYTIYSSLWGPFFHISRSLKEMQVFFSRVDFCMG